MEATTRRTCNFEGTKIMPILIGIFIFASIYWTLSILDISQELTRIQKEIDDLQEETGIEYSDWILELIERKRKIKCN